MRHTRLTLTALALTLALSACVTAPPEPPAPAKPQVSPQARLEAVKAAGQGSDERELNVQPLRDPQVEDLRETAANALAKNDAKAAAQVLDQALEITPEDPAVLQERAEVALLLADDAQAEAFAHKAIQLGSKTGPLCRRHWATIWQARLARGDEANAASAQTQIQSCTVAGLNRY